MSPEVTDADWADARILWNYHQMGHTPRPVDAGIVLGCHDLGVADTAATLWHAGLAPVLVCSGADNPTRADLFPDGEAAAFAARLIELDVDQAAVLLEPHATNTGANIRLSRNVLAAVGVHAASLMIVSMPYMQRRAFTTCRAVWPEVDVVCAANQTSLDDYVKTIGDDHLVLDHLVGDLQRIIEYPARGFAIAQDIPQPVTDAYRRLIAAGYTRRMLGA
ncbi:YdcF family protein [Actinocatenispora comari]|jgi:uncharacterized SAM-binding protein YcdF (DUF218 family)|uniref:DUF218 domain-containing protein n=1 Tax=Actinocatenispora comari TaxID=2807577 RepID=A0A8J4AD04_9ACTN|nr:YdcF family protein [Actinocatenispora comari]GIL29041.1 hypothetical protein NUM_42950 [Actinocatenispora comari]